MHPNYKEEAIYLCKNKTSAEMMATICEAKINGAPPELIQHMQQILDLSSRGGRSLERKETVLCAGRCGIAASIRTHCTNTDQHNDVTTHICTI